MNNSYPLIYKLSDDNTTDYTALTNKPTINTVSLTGDLSSSDLGIANATDVGTLTDLTTTTQSSLVGAVNEINGKFPVSVTNGGTGQTNLSSGEILLGNGTDGILSVDVLPITSGGTGATTAADVRTVLGVMTGTSLWGNASGATTTISFTGNYSDYTYIYVQGEDNDVATCNIFRPVTASKVSIFNWYATAASNPIGIYYHGCYLEFSYSATTDKTTVTFTRSGIYTVKKSASEADTWTEGSGISITKIMGYK